MKYIFAALCIVVFFTLCSQKEVKVTGIDVYENGTARIYEEETCSTVPPITGLSQLINPYKTVIEDGYVILYDKAGNIISEGPLGPPGGD